MTASKFQTMIDQLKKDNFVSSVRTLVCVSVSPIVWMFFFRMGSDLVICVSLLTGDSRGVGGWWPLTGETWSCNRTPPPLNACTSLAKVAFGKLASFGVCMHVFVYLQYLLIPVPHLPYWRLCHLPARGIVCICVCVCSCTQKRGILSWEDILER